MAHEKHDDRTGFFTGPVSDLSGETIRDLFVRLDTVERAEQAQPTPQLAQWEDAIRSELRERRQRAPRPHLRPAGGAAAG